MVLHDTSFSALALLLPDPRVSAFATAALVAALVAALATAAALTAALAALATLASPVAKLAALATRFAIAPAAPAAGTTASLASAAPASGVICGSVVDLGGRSSILRRVPRQLSVDPFSGRGPTSRFMDAGTHV